jgi:hypothetical protein
MVHPLMSERHHFARGGDATEASSAKAMSNASSRTRAAEVASESTQRSPSAKLHVSPHNDERTSACRVPSIAGEGCVYGAFAGTLTLRISDSTMIESAAWVREAQQRFAMHPGLRGWQPLHRSFPYELDANRAISRPVCDKLEEGRSTVRRVPVRRHPGGCRLRPAGDLLGRQGRQRDHDQKVGRMRGSMYSNQRYWRHVLRRRPELTP